MKKICLAALLALMSACTVNVNNGTAPDGNTMDNNSATNTGDTTPSADPGDGFDATTGLNEQMTLLLDRRDSKQYPVTKIGDQFWMAQNLAYDVEGSRSFGLEDPRAGFAYAWTEVMNGAASSEASPSGVQGICPAGWHVPSDKEWMVMEQALGMTAEQANASGTSEQRGEGFGDRLKASDTWSEGAGNNTTGFNALAVGYVDGATANVGFSSTFWTSTGRINPNPNISEAWYRSLNSDDSAIERRFGLQGVRYGVRCVLD